MAARPALAAEPSFLDLFHQLGCYLDDLSLRPIDACAGSTRSRRSGSAPSSATSAASSGASS